MTWSGGVETAGTTTATEGRNGIIRWYDPVTGRWLSNDPVGISGGLNQYAAMADNPVNLGDPTGRATLWINGKKQAVDTADQFYGALSAAAANGPIETFLYRGHGDTAGALSLGHEWEGYVFYNDMKRWLAAHPGAFSDTAKIYLEGCGTANPNYAGNRVADAIKRACPNAEVWGFSGLSFPTPFGYVSVPNNWYWGRSTKVDGLLNPLIPRKSVWAQIK